MRGEGVVRGSEEETSTRPRILITRAPHQASELAEGLRARGFEPVLVPAIELVEPSSFAALDAALSQLAATGEPAFHWLLFTSANAVEAFSRRLNERPYALSLMASPLQVAAIGVATARALRSALGREADLVPLQAVAESLAEALLPYALQPDGRPSRFLLVRAETARDHLPETLRAAGARVAIAAAYRTQVPASSIAQLQQLFSDRARYPDAVAFTSSSTAQNLYSLLEAAEVKLPAETLRVSIGPITSRTLRDLGYPPHAEAAEASVSALVEALVEILPSATR